MLTDLIGGLDTTIAGLHPGTIAKAVKLQSYFDMCGLDLPQAKPANLAHPDLDYCPLPQ
jgi:hypothetical protein